jgi:hypothetical protein
MTEGAPDLPSSPRAAWRPLLTGPGAAAVVLAAFWIFLLSSLGQASLTVDELGHATAGTSYWRFNDYRLDPENGNLPQRVMGLPLWLGFARFPSADAEDWRTANVWGVGDQWFDHLGNDVAAMLFRGRAAMGLLAVALGALVWRWSRRLFGDWGGLLSLLLFVLSPIVLANGALMTSDTCAALFYFASVWSVWRVLHRITPVRVAMSGLCVGALFVSKLSAVLIGPIALVLVGVRLLGGRPLPIDLAGPREVRRRTSQALAFAAVGLIQLAIIAGVIWGCYGFRYTAFAGPDADGDHFYRKWEIALDRPDPIELLGQAGLSVTQRAEVVQVLKAQNVSPDPWQPGRVAAFAGIERGILTPAQTLRIETLLAAPPPAFPARLADRARRQHWLPEAYIYGYVYAWRFSQVRTAFLNGSVSLSGWRWFFPYVFLIKTPLAEFGIGALALYAALVVRRQSSPSAAGRIAHWPALYETVPLWTLIGVYGLAALGSRFNVGNRHLLVIFPPLFVVYGAAAAGLEDARQIDRGRILALAGLITALMTEVFCRYPNYLAYLNVAAGSPKQAYRHLVDSSLDWGQDLPGVKTYLERHLPKGPVYFSYFGTASPSYYQIDARRLYSIPGFDVPPPFKIVTLAPDQLAATRQDASYQIVGDAPAPGGRTSLLLLENASALRLTGGTYLISASMLQPVSYTLSGPLGPWNDRFESIYQELKSAAQPLLNDAPDARLAALGQRSFADWGYLLPRFDLFRFARLTAYLRQREPDEAINCSILVYHLSDADLDQALNGPAPERGPDLPQAYLSPRPP